MGARVSLTQRTFHQGDFVLFRDAEAFYAGASPAECTFVCRVTESHAGDRYHLRDMRSDRKWLRASADCMRPLGGPAEVMRDIDTAPLESGDVSGLESAAVAWLRQQAGDR